MVEPLTKPCLGIINGKQDTLMPIGLKTNNLCWLYMACFTLLLCFLADSGGLLASLGCTV